jgi:hypothetical protein
MPNPIIKYLKHIQITAHKTALNLEYNQSKNFVVYHQNIQSFKDFQTKPMNY